MADLTVLFDGVQTVFETLKQRGRLIGIVSTKFRYRIVDIIKRDDMLKFVDIIIGGEDVKQNKPSPEGLFTAINRLNCQRNDVLYVGDSITDYKTAHHAGVDFAAVTTGTTSRQDFLELGVEKIVDDLMTLQQCLKG